MKDEIHMPISPGITLKYFRHFALAILAYFLIFVVTSTAHSQDRNHENEVSGFMTIYDTIQRDNSADSLKTAYRLLDAFKKAYPTSPYALIALGYSLVYGVLSFLTALALLFLYSEIPGVTLDARGDQRVGLGELDDSKALDPLADDVVAAIVRRHVAEDLGRRSDPVKVAGAGVFHLRVLL
jgi:hypothetical protein